MFCDGVSPKTLRQDDWKASFLRVWVDRTTSPRVVVQLCLSEMASSADAAENYREVLGSSSPKGVRAIKIAISEIPEVHAVWVARYGFEFVEFAESNYVVTIVAEDIPTLSELDHSIGISEMRRPVSTLAIGQYRRLSE